MSLIRLLKIIPESTILSRRKGDLLIRQGKVTLNGLKKGEWKELKTNEWNPLLD